jgi:protein MpaA
MDVCNFTATPVRRRLARAILTMVTLMTMSAGCATNSSGIHADGPPRADGGANARDALRAPREQTVVLGRSIEGVDLVMHCFGDGSRPVLVLGGIHGNEPESVALTEALLELLRRGPGVARGRSVAVFPRVNPDGLARRSRYNVKGIDLNRNFPATNWKPSKRRGRQPANQPESRAVMKAVRMLSPRCVISIHSISGAHRKCNNYDGPARGLAERMARHNGYPVTDDMGYPTPGSFGSWCGIDGGIPTITLELPRGIDSESAWRENRAALIEAVVSD